MNPKNNIRIKTQPKAEKQNQTIRNMKKHERPPARIVIKTAIANLTKKRHSKLSFGEFHKSNKSIIIKTEKFQKA
ncbi:hypothetical protein BCV75_07920 [Xylella fastidiosa]|nr:hypothetical protein BCV75_07920 [Xylella fastidiosa]AVI23129.1 hypothetical protein BC375_07980 [Xylella fastidiosa]KIA58047.1 hypothetical protein RA12_05740 [Xylella fastidiosa]